MVKTAREAGGEKYGACVVYCLLVVKKWCCQQAQLELWDAEVHGSRAIACEFLAKHIIEHKDNTDEEVKEMLLQRYSMTTPDKDENSPLVNALELAVDNHALNVISSSGYQQCIDFLWRGWYISDPNDVSHFIEYRHKDNTRFWSHFHPDRLRVPAYQNVIHMGFSFLYLALYTAAINSINDNAHVDLVEWLLYTFTLGFICDELTKIWKVGRQYIAFWNVFHLCLYALVSISFSLRVVAMGYKHGSDQRDYYNDLGYKFLAATAPMFWGRILLYLDSLRFFGAMLVVLKVMMKESIIFFALLAFIIVGFLQAFLGLDQVDNGLNESSFVMKAMVNAVMGSPDFESFDSYAPPFGLVLYYIYSFVIMVVLLNILIALYNSAYEDITGNAANEYMALFAQKTMRFVRAPDENVFIPPLNLIEIFILIIPFEWWMDRRRYAALNDAVMLVLYSPFLLLTSWLESRKARAVKRNRMGSAEDDHQEQTWDAIAHGFDAEEDGWGEKVTVAKPNVEAEPAVVEIRELRKEVDERFKVLEAMIKGKSAGNAVESGSRDPEADDGTSGA